MISTLGVALIAAAIAAVVFVPDDSTSTIALQALVVALAAGGASVAFYGASLKPVVHKA